MVETSAGLAMVLERGEKQHVSYGGLLFVPRVDADCGTFTFPYIQEVAYLWRRSSAHTLRVGGEGDMKVVYLLQIGHYLKPAAFCGTHSSSWPQGFPGCDVPTVVSYKTV